MGKFRIVVIFIFFIAACSSDESWRQNLNGTLDSNNPMTFASCSSAEYSDWANSPYKLPYPSGEGYVVGLNACSSSYHAPGQPDQFAIDFNMPIGERITAARSGRVVYIEESGFDGGFPNNLVIVKHQDNTHGMYMHLTNEGAAVNVGDNVSQGSLIGYSGNTGLAGYPHLHFVVSNESYSWPYQSLPVNFSNTIANEKGPESGGLYIAE